jgi:hypothetical protein
MKDARLGKVPCSIYEGARDTARDITRTAEGLVSRRQRKKIEMLFAHLKRVSTGSDSAGRTVRVMNSTSPPPHKTSENSPC